MAEKDPIDENDINMKNDKKNKKSKEKKGGFWGKLILGVIFLTFIGLIAVVGFNFAGLRETYLRGVIDSIPIVKSLIPAPVFEDGEDPRSFMTNAELVSQLEILQNEIERLYDEKDDLTKRIGIYTAEIENLRIIEEQQEQFRRDKNEFDELIAMRDPVAYTKFYSSIYPENADTLYREAVGASERAQELKRLTNTVSSMEERASARMLETLMTTDMDLVVLLLKNISTDISGSIIESMSPENAAAVVKRMAPAE